LISSFTHKCTLFPQKTQKFRRKTESFDVLIFDVLIIDVLMCCLMC